MTVSFVIPSWNGSRLLAPVLRSLRALQLPAGVQIEALVVDNGSTDDSAAVASKHGATVLPLGRNLGVSRALNEGIQAARGEYVALLNNDVELDARWLACLLDVLQQPGVWFSTGRILQQDDATQIDGAGDAICRGGAAWRLGAGKPDSALFRAPRRTFFPSATAALFRREFFEEVGPLESRFFAYLEDVDLGLRASLAGLEGAYAPNAVAYHRGSETTGQWSPRMVRWMTAHQLLLLAKFYPARLLWRFAAPIVAAQTLWAALAVSRGRGLAWLQGCWLGFGDWRSIRRENSDLRKDERLACILEAAERELLDVQRQSGWDSYWKWYERLAWPRLGAAS